MRLKVVVTKEKGFSGLLAVYRRTVKELLSEKGKCIAYFACEGTCVPFIELLSYSIRDRGHDMFYIREVDVETFRKIEEREDVGMQIGEKEKTKLVDLAVVMGGLAKPMSSVRLEDVKKAVERVLRRDGKVLGVCFLDMFKKAGWENSVFDYVINMREDSLIEVKQFKV